MGVFIARLHFNATAERKLADRGIAVEDVEAVASSSHHVARNRRPRVTGSRLLIGPDAGGRCLTVVLQPDAADDAVWHVMTAWVSTASERAAWRRWR